ncbi:MAG: hypothetical protein HY689_10075 [Chloroflexi bacterium]|nr:hypothetical protein [Chloroflexota bacterium]
MRETNGPLVPHAAQPPPPAQANDAVGGEVRIGMGRAPGWVRWFNYAVYVACIAYLVVVFPPDGRGYGIQLAFAAVVAAWLVYIFVGKRPPEP